MTMEKDLEANLAAICIVQLRLYNVVKFHIKESKLPVRMEQIPVLTCIYDKGIICQQEVADLLMRDKSSVQRTITTLSHKGMLQIDADQSDKRKNLLQLTEYGTLLVQQLISGNILITASWIAQNLSGQALSIIERQPARQVLRHP